MKFCEGNIFYTIYTLYNPQKKRLEKECHFKDKPEEDQYTHWLKCCVKNQQEVYLHVDSLKLLQKSVIKAQSIM